MTRIRFAYNWEGAWSTSARYLKDDLVYYQGSTWKAVVANTAQAPTEGTYWTVFAQKGDAGGSVTLASMGVFTPQSYGATVDGATSDYTAITTAAAAALAAGGMLWFPPDTQGYATATPVVLPAGIDVIMDAPLVYTGSATPMASPLLTIGATATNNRKRRLRIKVSRTTQSTWADGAEWWQPLATYAVGDVCRNGYRTYTVASITTGISAASGGPTGTAAGAVDAGVTWDYTAATWETDVGVRFYGVYESDIEIEATGFTIGAQLFGDGAGVSYNAVRLGTMQSNKVALDLCSTTGGWVNENVITGGRFWVASGVNRAIDRYGVRIVSRDGGYVTQNNNVFIKPSFELNASNCTANANYTATARGIGFCVADGQKNTVHDCRDEDNTAVAEFRAASGDNQVIIGYGSSFTALHYGSSANAVSSGGTKLADRCTRLVFAMPDLISVYGPYTSGTPRVQVPGCAWGNSTNGTMNKAQTSITIGTDYLEWATSRDLGVRVDTSACKEFAMARMGPAGGRVMVRCYDASGTQLDPTADVVPYVRGDLLRPFSESSEGGGSYRTGSDTTGPVYIQFSAEVYSAQISIRGGTANAQIRGFAIFAGPFVSAPRCWAGYTGDTEYRAVATELPAIGTHVAGRLVWNAAPAGGAALAWTCTTGGSPGTWEVGAYLPLDATATWDPGNLADGAGETSSAVAIAGAAFGDLVDVAAPYDLQGITATAYVSSAGNVKARLQNETGGAIDLASGTWRFRLRKQ